MVFCCGASSRCSCSARRRDQEALPKREAVLTEIQNRLDLHPNPPPRHRGGSKRWQRRARCYGKLRGRVRERNQRAPLRALLAVAALVSLLPRPWLHPYLPWQRLYFLPEPHGHGSLRPTLSASRFTAVPGGAPAGACSVCPPWL